MKISDSKTILAIVLIALGVLTRIAPHPMNFTAIGAIGLLAGMVIGNRIFSFVLPLAAMAIADLFLPNGFSPVVYAGISMMVIIGMVLGSNANYFKIGGGALVGTTVFFIITNLPFWYSFYPNTLAGAMESYTLALPFYFNQILADLSYSIALVAIYRFATKRIAAIA
jgi:hypothetical protein